MFSLFALALTYGAAGIRGLLIHFRDCPGKIRRDGIRDVFGAVFGAVFSDCHL